jgi:heat shock protein HslJ
MHRFAAILTLSLMNTDAQARPVEGVLSDQARIALPAGAAQPAPDQLYRARGTEPFWSLTIAGGQVELIPNIGMTPLRAPLPLASLDGADVVFDMLGAGMVLRLSDTICHDLMAGTPYPQTVTVTWQEGELQGCGGESIDFLADVAWVVKDMDNAGIVDSANVTLEFDAAARRVVGQGGCNRYHAAFDLSGEGLSIGPVAATRMACAPAVIEQEQRFFALLSRISRFDIAPSGALLPYSNDQSEPLMTARIGD